MFEILRGIDTGIIAAITLCWIIVNNMIGRLPSLPHYKQMQRRSRVSLFWLVLTTLLIVGKLVVLALTWSQSGWWLVEDRVLLVLPLIIPALIATWVYSLPRLWYVLIEKVPEPQASISQETWDALASPWLVIPPRAAMWGAIIASYVTLAVPPVQPYGKIIAITLAVHVVIILLLIVWYQRQMKQAKAFEKSVTSRGFVRVLRIGAIILVCCIIVGSWFGWSMATSWVPGRVGMMGHSMDFGGGPASEHNTHMNHTGMTSVTTLTGPRTGEPDQRFTLTAQKNRVKLTSGATVDAWTFNGQAPGPELRMRQGELVEITLINQLPDVGVTLHWHGLDVPNAEDGVAGVTQNAVQPGERYTYRFIAEQVGSYWYHSHQASDVQVKMGLFGTLVVLPPEEKPAELDIMVPLHTWKSSDGSELAFGLSNTIQRHKVTPGSTVRLRLLNTDNLPQNFVLTGTPFKVIAIDGTAINKPTELENVTLLLGSGARYDITFTMPETPVLLHTLKKMKDVGLLFSRDGAGEVTPITNGPEFDPATYGSPLETPFNASSTFDRQYVQIFDSMMGFYNGKWDTLWMINGQVFPHTPMVMVREGDLVKITFVNRSFMDHPMHLHGHHMLVLNRNGKPVMGSPWWVDTLNVAPGETYEIAFEANNPGLWMDHCHNLNHAVNGMVMHLGYEGVTSPFEMGRDTLNQPE